MILLFCDITIKKNVNSILFVSPKEIIVPDINFNCLRFENVSQKMLQAPHTFLNVEGTAQTQLFIIKSPRHSLFVTHLLNILYL